MIPAPLPVDGTQATMENDVRPPPAPPPNATRLSFPPPRAWLPMPTQQKQLVEYKIPLEKVRPTKVTNYAYYIPPGSLADPTVLVRPVSPTTPFEFPFEWGFETQGDAWHLGDINACKSLTHESVKRVVGLMRMCGLTPESDTCAFGSHVIKGIQLALRFFHIL